MKPLSTGKASSTRLSVLLGVVVVDGRKEEAGERTLLHRRAHASVTGRMARSRGSQLLLESGADANQPDARSGCIPLLEVINTYSTSSEVINAVC